MGLSWGQFGVIWIWGNNYDQCKDPYDKYCLTSKVHICFIICQMFMMQAHWSMDTSIPGFFFIFYYHSLFYSLGHDTTIVMSHCTIVIWHTMLAPELRFWQIIVQYYITIVEYDVTIVAPWWQSIWKITDWLLWYFESVCNITDSHVTRNWI